MSVSTFNGPGVDGVLKRVEESLSDGLVPVEIFNDDEVFGVEMDSIFGTCWVFVAHESEIPKAGDFVQRRIGLDPVIVTRDGKGGVNVMSNFCRHRGAQVCQTDAGNSRFFKCPYHGWTYNNEGDLVGTPHMNDAYGERLDPKHWGLKRVPRIEIRSGFIFASLAQEGPSLEEFLGGAGWMLDLMVGLHPDSMRVAGPPERYKVKANWKTAAENFAGDAYHVDTLHWSNEEVSMVQGLQGNCETAHLYDFGNGHGNIAHPWPEIIHPGYVLWGYPPEVTRHFDLSGLDEAQLQVVNNEPPTTGTIFPNFSYLRVNSPTIPNGPMSVVTTFRQWQPIGPGEMEIWNWQFVWNFMTEDQALESATAGQFVFGSAGTFEQDDTVAWEGAPQAAKSPWMRREGMAFNYQQSQRSPVDTSPDPSYRGPGLKRNTGFGEDNQLSFYRTWLQTMRHGAQTADGNGNAS